MGTVCPQGHDSASSDFCDVCGTTISSSPSRGGMTGKHHAPGRFVASAGETCPRCGAPVVGQFCDACGFRVSARRPFAPLGGGHPEEASSPAPAAAQTAVAAPTAPAAPWETSPSGLASSGPPESLFAPVPKPEPPLFRLEPAGARAFPVQPAAFPVQPAAPGERVR